MNRRRMDWMAAMWWMNQLDDTNASARLSIGGKEKEERACCGKAS